MARDRDPHWLKKRDRKSAEPMNVFEAHGAELEKWPLFEVDPDTEVWIDALRIADDKKDLKPLAYLLRSEQALTSEARAYIADLIERRVGKKGQRQPAYTMSRADRAKFEAAAMVRGMIDKRRMTVAEAIEIVSKREGIPRDKLANYYRLGK